MVVKHCPACGEKLAVAVKSCPCGYIFMARKGSGKPTERKVEICGERLRPDRFKKDAHRESEFYYHGMVKIGSSSSNGNVNKNVKRNNGVRESENTAKEDANKKFTSDEGLTTEPSSVTAEDREESVCQDEDAAPVKKRGRPKGSKDKKKRLPKGYKDMHPAELISLTSSTSSTRNTSVTKSVYCDSFKDDYVDEARVPRRRGRPRGSKTKVQRSPSLLDSRKSDDKAEENDERKERYVPVQTQTLHIPSEKKEAFSLILGDINQKIVGQTWHM